MANLSPSLARLTDELPADQRKDIEATIASSPYLQRIMTEAINAGALAHIRLGKPGTNESGSYHRDEKAIYLSPDTFTRAAFRDDSEKRLDAITSTLGHETGHALYAEKAEKERYAASYVITEGIRAAGQGGQFDATAAVNGYIRSSRRDEALAEIHGWNALASRIEHTKGSPPDPNEMLRRADASTDCVDLLKRGAYQLAPGIVLDANMQMSDTRLPKVGSINLEPVAQCHFDQSRASLGAGGAANYPNYYAAYLIEQLAEDTRGWVRPPTIQLDMAKLGLDKAQLESTGLRLPAEGFEIVDSSQGRFRPVVLCSAGSGMQGTPDDPAQQATQAHAEASPLMNQPGHPAYTLSAQTLALIERGDAVQAGSLNMDEKTRMAAGIVAQALARDSTMTGIDALYRDCNAPVASGLPASLIAFQGDARTDYYRCASVNPQEAVQTPLEQSSQRAQNILLDRQQELAQQQAQEQARKQQQEMEGATLRIGPRTLSQGSQGDSGGDGGGGE